MAPRSIESSLTEYCLGLRQNVNLRFTLKYEKPEDENEDEDENENEDEDEDEDDGCRLIPTPYYLLPTTYFSEQAE
jgi:hypothetical protein